MSNKRAPGRLPDFLLVAKPKDAPAGSGGSYIGAAWRTGEDNNGISIRLNAGVRLGWDDELWLTLWPNVPFKKGSGKRHDEVGSADRDEPPGVDPIGDTDFPF